MYGNGKLHLCSATCFVNNTNVLSTLAHSEHPCCFNGSIIFPCINHVFHQLPVQDSLVVSNLLSFQAMLQRTSL